MVEYPDESLIWLVSDTHFHHGRLVRLSPNRFPECRTYDTVAEMDADIVNKWVGTVHPEDTVIFLGDFMMHVRKAEYAEEFFRIYGALPGKKVYILGNHDDKLAETVHGIELMNSYDFTRGGKVFHCRHYPFSGSEMRTGDTYIHGHTHSTVRYELGQNNVSWEAWYRPAALSEMKACDGVPDSVEGIGDANGSCGSYCN